MRDEYGWTDGEVEEYIKEATKKIARLERRLAEVIRKREFAKSLLDERVFASASNRESDNDTA